MSDSTLTWLVLGAYALLAASVVTRLAQRGSATFDDALTSRDRRLIAAAAFYLGVPLVLVLHFGGHILCARLLGAPAASEPTAFLWDRIDEQAQPPMHAWRYAAIVAAGVAVPLVTAGILALDVHLRPINAAWNFARLELARLTVVTLLLVYPAMSLLLDVGDFAVLRRQLDRVRPYLGEGMALTWLAGAGLVVWQWFRGGWRQRFVELTTPWFHMVADARRAVEKDASDGASWAILGRAYLASGRIERAHDALARACELAPEEPEAQLLLGLVLLKKERATEASEHLRIAGRILEDRRAPSKHDNRLLYEAMLALTHARMSLDDSEGALLTTEAALELRERDGRALLLHSDALVLAGRLQDAKAWLQQARVGAEGVLAREIRRRLATLARQTR